MFHIKLCHWHALSPHLSDESAWISWDGCLKKTEANPSSPEIKLIPMLQARRMSNACKLACEVALNLLKKTNDKIDAAVFVSQHSELARSTKIIESIIQNQAVSPTDFSMSVHNTAAGLASILSKNEIEISSVCAGTDSFQQGLFEVQSFFAQGAKKVMLLDFDDKVPEIYNTGDLFNFPPYACGFIISNENEYHCLTKEKNTPSMAINSPQSLQLLKNHLENHNTFSINSTDHHWLWVKS